MENQNRTPYGSTAYLVIGLVALAIVTVSGIRLLIGGTDNFWTPLGSALTLTAMIIGFVSSRRQPRRRARVDEGEQKPRF